MREKITKEFLIEEIHVKVKTIEKIAEETGYSQGHISNMMRKFDVKKHPRKKYIGKEFGLLTPLREIGLDKYSHLILECQCRCGNILPVTSGSLSTKNTTSCGCNNRKRRDLNKGYKGYKEISGILWSSMKRGAECRNLTFEITLEEIWHLYVKQNRKCALSGVSIEFAYTSDDCKYGTASLDRIDSSKGYILDNVQWVHKKINAIKMDMEEQDFIYWCILIADHYLGKNRLTDDIKDSVVSSYDEEKAYNFGLENKGKIIDYDSIPTWIFTKPENIVKKYLDGLFDKNDSKYYGCFCQKIRGAKTLVKLMNKIDITCKIEISGEGYSVSEI